MRLWKKLDEAFPIPPFSILVVCASLALGKIVSEIGPRVCVVLRVSYVRCTERVSAENYDQHDVRESAVNSRSRALLDHLCDHSGRDFAPGE